MSMDIEQKTQDKLEQAKAEIRSLVDDSSQEMLDEAESQGRLVIIDSGNKNIVYRGDGSKNFQLTYETLVKNKRYYVRELGASREGSVGFLYNVDLNCKELVIVQYGDGDVTHEGKGRIHNFGKGKSTALLKDECQVFDWGKFEGIGDLLNDVEKQKSEGGIKPDTINKLEDAVNFGVTTIEEKKKEWAADTFNKLLAIGEAWEQASQGKSFSNFFEQIQKEQGADGEELVEKVTWANLYIPKMLQLLREFKAS